VAIKLEVCSLIVPITSIKQKLGDAVYEKRYSLITDWCWHDDYLYRDGCMDALALNEMLTEWEGKGFQLMNIINGRKYWHEVCVVNSDYGPSYPCDWLEYDNDKNIVWLKGTAPGEIIGPQR